MKIKNVLVGLTIVFGLGLAGLSSSNAQQSLPPNEAACWSVIEPESGVFTIFRCGTCELVENVETVRLKGVCYFSVE
jgi:predicted  nucleic acid-binding Zn ribbon protein